MPALCNPHSSPHAPTELMGMRVVGMSSGNGGDGNLGKQEVGWFGEIFLDHVGGKSIV